MATLPASGFGIALRTRSATTAVLFALISVAAGCTPQSSSPHYPRYNFVYGIGTHNSYWINRSDQTDYFSSGTQELLSDQFLHDHVRAIELDVHSERAPAGRWKVYHTSGSEDFSCRFLEDCLEMLRNFQYALPNHEVINVIVELKNTVAYTGIPSLGIHTQHNFTADHTIQQFDDTFRRILGPALYTPHDFRTRCTLAQKTLVDCAGKAGWPTIDQLRGRFMINIHGNWSTAAYDWVQYATSGIQDRVAFPIQTVYGVDASDPQKQQPGLSTLDYCYSLDNYGAPVELTTRALVWFPVPGLLPYCIRSIDTTTTWCPSSSAGCLVAPSPAIDLSRRQAAFNESIFWQLEDLTDPTRQVDPHLQTAGDKAQAFLDGNGIIRGGDSYDYHPGCDTDPKYAGQCQESRISRGFQLIQTDYPWHFVHDEAPAGLGIPTDPSQRLRDRGWTMGASAPPIYEPGSRLYFHAQPPFPGPPLEPWAYTSVPDVSRRWWETTVSTTRNGDTWRENTHDGLILDDYLKTCPQPGGSDQKDCTNYARRAQDWGEGSLQVASRDGTNWMMISRQKNTTPGASYYQEGVDLYVRLGRHGQSLPDREFEAPRYGPCRGSDDPNSDNVSWVCIGSMIALSVDNRGGSSVVTVYSAGMLRQGGLPDWHMLAQEKFDAPMTKQGFSAVGDVLFVGPRVAATTVPIEGGSQLRYVALSDLPGRQGPPATIVDLSR